MDRTPKQVQDLTLALLYLTSLEDHDDPASRRCWKGYDFQTLADLQAQGLVGHPRVASPSACLPGHRPGQGRAAGFGVGGSPALTHTSHAFKIVP